VCGSSTYNFNSSLKNTYRKHAKRLRRTGEGVQENEDSSQGSEETHSFYIMGDGPCVETPPHAVNIWSAWLFIYLTIRLTKFLDQIEEEFPFFPTLHRILASRPNITPIVITTALGPQGPKTVWYQPPDNNGNTDDNRNIDPQLLNEPATVQVAPPTPQRERSFGNDVGGLVNAKKMRTPGPQHGPKPSSASREAIENAYKTISKLPQKRSLADTLMEIQRYIIYCVVVIFSYLFLGRILPPRRLKIEAAPTLSCVSRLLMR
jgi:hypothetical protein